MMVKYKKVLCKYCNNSRTQPYDRAYDEFINYIELNADACLVRRQLDFKLIYGEGWRASQLDLFKYFVKAFGCRISDAGLDVPRDLCDVYSNQGPEIPILVCFAVNENELDKPKQQRQRLGIGNLIHSVGSAGDIRLMSSSYYRWLLNSYWYKCGPFGPVGEPWCREQQFICLGSYNERDAEVQVARDDGSLVHWPSIEA